VIAPRSLSNNRMRKPRNKPCTAYVTSKEHTCYAGIGRIFVVTAQNTKGYVILSTHIINDENIPNEHWTLIQAGNIGFD